MTIADEAWLREMCSDPDHVGSWWSAAILDLLDTVAALRQELNEEKREANRMAQELSRLGQDWDAP